MFPKWFDKWNRDNPTDVFRPAIIIGTVGGAVFAATMLIAWGQPFATDSMQTGPRGTGMSVPEFTADLAKPDPHIELLIEDPPFVPEPGEALAKDIYQNVKVLGDLTDANFNRLMAAMTRWVSPEQGCAYCHGDCDIETYGEDNLYTKVVARRMIQMTQNINEAWDGHVNANKQVGVTCMTCHRGENVPSDIWFKMGDVNETMAGWSANQNRVTAQSQFTSLPSDALEKYLLDGEAIGVNCVFCHNSRAFYDGAQVTPQWATESLGIQMVLEMNNDYLVPLEDQYPPERLGPVHADAPKAACATCHKGYQQPLQGTNVIKDWPELATTGVPDYGN